MESSAINTPHPGDVSKEEDFFGGEETGLPTLTPEQQAAEAARYQAEKGERIEPASEEGQSNGTPSALQEPAQAIANTDVAQEPAQAEEGAEPAGDAPTATEAARGGNAEREYVVLHRVSLTEALLIELLDEVRSGNVAEARTAFLELHRIEARNDRVAIGDAYKTHKDRLGEKCDLVAPTARSFKVRHVEPRQRVEENLTIT